MPALSEAALPEHSILGNVQIFFSFAPQFNRSRNNIINIFSIYCPELNTHKMPSLLHIYEGVSVP